MTRNFGLAPTAADMEAMALAALNRLPEEFRKHGCDVVLQVQDYADAETLKAVGIENPLELSGLFEGFGLTEQSIEQSGQLPNRVSLYRVPILLEWAERGNETLEHLVAHVLIHEIGHHFGLSDADMDALEDMAD